LKPSFICTLDGSAQCIETERGLLVTTVTDLIAAVGIKSQLTVSPNASLMRTPFW
jgi:hypothetical protein